MKSKICFMLCIFLIFGLGVYVEAQVDSDGDLNADITDPFPNDPNQGGVYIGGSITYDVLLAGDLDAAGFTGTVITINGDNVTFDGNNHRIIAPEASHAFIASHRYGITLSNCDIVGEPTTAIYFVHVSNSLVENVVGMGTGGGTGIYIQYANNDTVRNCNFSNRYVGVQLYHTKATQPDESHVIEGNILTNCPYMGIYQINPANGNQFINNDVSGSGNGIYTFGTCTVIGNNFSQCGIAFSTYGFSSNWGLDLATVLSQNNFNGAGRGFQLNSIVADEIISGLDFTGSGISGCAIGIHQSEYITIRDLTIPVIDCAIQASKFKNSLIEGVTAIGVGRGNGLYLQYANENTVRNCNFSNHYNGITIYHANATQPYDGNLIEGNIVSDCVYRGISQIHSASENRIIDNDLSGANIGLYAVGAGLISRNLMSDCGTGLYLKESPDAIVFHNNIFDNSYYNVISDQSIELSFNGEGNYWGHPCPGPLFSSGEDSNGPGVVDSYPYGLHDGWLNPFVTPGCPPIKNQPPVAKAGPDQVIDCTPSTGVEVILDGSLSSDPDNDPLTYAWSEGATHLGGGDILTLTLLPGVHTITLTVDDGNGGSHDDEVVVTIIADTEAPIITLDGNNPLNVIRFSGPYTDPGADVTDNCDPAPSLVTSGVEDVNTNLPGTYSIAYNAADLYGNEAEEVFRTVNVIDDPDALIHPYLFLSDKKIMVDKMGQAEGNMHSNDEIDIKKGPATFTGDVTACGKIDIAKDITIDGDVTAGGELQLDNNVTITGTAIEYADVSEVLLPQLSYSAGSNDVKIKKNKSKSLTPGSYGKIEAEKKATLQLSTGVYFIEELILKEKVRFEIDISTGPVTVNVVKKVDMNKDVIMSLSPLGERDSRYLTINAMEDLQIDKGSRLLGFFNAPEGKVQLKKEVYLRGAICAEEIDVDKDAEALYHLAGQQPMIPEWENPIASTEDIKLEEAVQTKVIILPEEFKLYQNSPNPFNPTTQITYTIPEISHITLKIFNMYGQEVRELVSVEQSAGQYTVTWDATDDLGRRVPSGMYIYLLRAGQFTQSRRCVLMK